MRHKIRLVIAALCTLCITFVSYAGAAGAATPPLKAAPERPLSTSDVLQAPLASKPTVAPLVGGWAVSLTASPQTLWPTQYSTLTATANSDVGPTPYYISIYDETSHTYIAICGTGTTCSRSVTQPTATTHYYIAYVSYYPSTNPPSTIVATSGTVLVTWKGVSISLVASPTTQWIGGSATLTSTTSADIGPSPFYAEIFDATTGTRIAYCGFGTICTATTSQSVATTHRFVAYVSNYSTAYPPTGIQATSVVHFVTWANTGYRLSLSSTRTGYGQDTLTAFSNLNVGPTPYYIEIFKFTATSHTRLAVCGSGTTCSVVNSLNFGQNNFVAFTSSYDTALPPLNTQASSNVISDWFLPIFTTTNTAR